MKNMKPTFGLSKGYSCRAGALAVLSAVCLLVVLSGCQNPAMPPDAAGHGLGSLSLTINGQGTGRTVMPNWPDYNDFVSFELEFLPNAACGFGNDPPAIISLTALSGTVELAAGTWDLSLTAFVAGLAGQAAREMARGELSGIVISSGRNVEKDITLQPIAGGRGLFSWDISFPTSGIAAVTSARMEITAWAGGTGPRVYYLVGGGGTPLPNPGSLELDTGEYFVTIMLSNSLGRVAVSEILHVWRNMESHLGGARATFTAEDFSSTMPLGLIGRWHLGGGEFAPFMYEFTADGRMVTAGNLLRRVVVSGNSIAAFYGADVLGTADFASHGNTLTLSNITGAAGFVPGVHYRRDITYTAFANNTANTTAINFEFSHSVSLLSVGDIMVVGGTGAVETGALTGGGTSWSLELTTLRAGNVWVSIDRPGIDGGARAVAVYPITWTVSANTAANTSAISFWFSYPVSDLTLDEVRLADGTGSVEVGALTGGGAWWSLALAVLSAGNVAVSIDRPGIEAVSRTLAVHPITWAAAANNAANTTAINFVFGASVPGLTADHIGVADGTGRVSTGALTGGGTSWTLEVTVLSAGEVWVWLDKPGIQGGTRGVAVHPISWAAAANNAASTSAINFVFGVPVSGLTADHIGLADGTGMVTRGALTGDGTSWTLEITVLSAGEVWVWLDKPGIYGGTRGVAVHPITWTATANDLRTTTAINFDFGVPVTGLTADHIGFAPGTGAVSPGALTGSGTSWTLEVSVLSAGEVWVWIDKPGIEAGARTVMVYDAPREYFAIGFADFVDMAQYLNVPIAGPSIRLFGSQGETTANITLTNPGQFDTGSIRWIFQGTQITGDMVYGSYGETLILGPRIHGSLLGFGTHFLTVEVKVNGVPYSRLITFTVVR